MGQRKRKHVDEFDIKQAEIIAPAVSDEIKSRAGNIVTLDYSTGYGSSDLYSMITNTDKEQYRSYLMLMKSLLRQCVI